GGAPAPAPPTPRGPAGRPVAATSARGSRRAIQRRSTAPASATELPNLHSSLTARLADHSYSTGPFRTLDGRIGCKRGTIPNDVGVRYDRAHDSLPEVQQRNPIDRIAGCAIDSSNPTAIRAAAVRQGR